MTLVEGMWASGQEPQPSGSISRARAMRISSADALRSYAANHKPDTQRPTKPPATAVPGSPESLRCSSGMQQETQPWSQVVNATPRRVLRMVSSIAGCVEGVR